MACSRGEALPNTPGHFATHQRENLDLTELLATGGTTMANRKSFLGALWDGDVTGAIGSLVAGIVHLIAMGLFLLLLGVTAPLLAVVMPFVAYQVSADNIGAFAAIYFFLGAFASALFTFMAYNHVTRKERRARGETFGQHCRHVLGYPTLCIIGSWVADAVFMLMFKDMLWSDSNIAHAIFFTLAPIAVFAPLWVFLIHRRRQKAAMDELHRRFVAMREAKDVEFLREQGIVS
jgi:hypothetical protein